jgi:trk system potassium uptake protein TrkH
MTEISRFLTIILMFIGGAPGSTAGGIKITTTALIIMTVVSVIKGRSDTEIYTRTIKKESVYKAIVIVVIDVMVVLISSMILAVTESGANLETVIFECVSAFGTVGLTLGLTENLSVVGKVIITIAMFFGRLGSLTMILSMINKKMPKSIKYPEDKILIG